MGTAERPDKPAGTSPTQLAIKVTERSAPRSASLLARFGLPGRVQHAQIDLILSEARKLDAELQAKDAMARSVAALHRQSGSAALSQGQPLPPAPPVLKQIQREHTAMLIQHYVVLRSALGPDGTALLDAYLDYEFAPHIKLRRMSPPGEPVAQSASSAAQQ